MTHGCFLEEVSRKVDAAKGGRSDVETWGPSWPTLVKSRSDRGLIEQVFGLFTWVWMFGARDYRKALMLMVRCVMGSGSVATEVV